MVIGITYIVYSSVVGISNLSKNENEAQFEVFKFFPLLLDSRHLTTTTILEKLVSFVCTGVPWKQRNPLTIGIYGDRNYGYCLLF